MKWASSTLVSSSASSRSSCVQTIRILAAQRQQKPVSDRDWGDAQLIDRMLAIHRDDPAFGYRLIADELARQGVRVGENRVQRLCSLQGIWSVFAKRPGAARKAGPSVHDDLVVRSFTAEAPNRVWLTDKIGRAHV